MGDQNVAERITLEIVLEPVAGFKVEVVGRLVEQQQFGLASNSLASAMRICQPP